MFGEKPLYYSNINKNFYFGSNINYITELSNKKFNLDYEKINISFNFGFKTFYFDKNTFFKKINSLEPGNSLIINNFEKIRLVKNSIIIPKVKNLSYKKIKNDLKKIFKRRFLESNKV